MSKREANEICEKYQIDDISATNFKNLVEMRNEIVKLYKLNPDVKLFGIFLRYSKQINDTINNFIANFNKYKSVISEELSPLDLIKKQIETRNE